MTMGTPVAAAAIPKPVPGEPEAEAKGRLMGAEVGGFHAELLERGLDKPTALQLTQTYLYSRQGLGPDGTPA